MPHAGFDDKVITEVFVDRLGLGGRFNDDDAMGNGIGPIFSDL
jgi:hypothetical protein